jgi:hypothetical protein
MRRGRGKVEERDRRRPEKSFYYSRKDQMVIQVKFADREGAPSNFRLVQNDFTQA